MRTSGLSIGISRRTGANYLDRIYSTSLMALFDVEQAVANLKES